MINNKKLYGLMLSDEACCKKLAENFKAMRYKSIEVDPDVWLKISMKPYVSDYYKYMIVYVDDILHLEEYTKPNITL